MCEMGISGGAAQADWQAYVWRTEYRTAFRNDLIERIDAHKKAGDGRSDPKEHIRGIAIKISEANALAGGSQRINYVDPDCLEHAVAFLGALGSGRSVDHAGNHMDNFMWYKRVEMDKSTYGLHHDVARVLWEILIDVFREAGFNTRSIIRLRDVMNEQCMPPDLRRNDNRIPLRCKSCAGDVQALMSSKHVVDEKKPTAICPICSYPNDVD